MLKALFLDLDETLCDTLGANEQATRLMGEALSSRYGVDFDGPGVARCYVNGIYRRWTESQLARYMPIIEQQGEGAFRLQLIRDLLAAQLAELQAAVEIGRASCRERVSSPV